MSKKVAHWKVVVVVAAALAMIVLLLAAQPAAAGATRLPIDGYNVPCAMPVPGRMWTAGGVEHLRGRELTSVVLSDEPYHAGTGEMIANYNKDLATGYMTYWGTLKIFPAAKDGYYSGIYVMQINENGVSGVARLQGHGPDLDGLKIRSVLTPLPPAALGQFADECGGPPIAATHAVGYILFPGD